MEQKTYLIYYIKTIANDLDFMYGSPDHNNKKDPLNELIFILLSRRTRKRGYEKTYNELRRRYPTWKGVAKARPEDLLKIIGKAGLGKRRVSEIQRNLNIINEKFGEYSLDRLKKWPTNQIFSFLTSLQGVGSKSAYCIMMYSLNKKVFPVDTHIKRICQRLGLIENGIDHKQAQKQLSDIFPKSLRYSLHVNMLSHGRERCKSRNPRCCECLIAGFCGYNRKERPSVSQPLFIDLFAGAGGMSLGFEDAGFHLHAAIDSNWHACSTFLYNRPELRPEQVIESRMEEINPKKFSKKGIKVMVAGLPCQEFSWVRTNGYGNWGRKELYKELLRFVDVIKPVFVVVENVPGMKSSTNEHYAKQIEIGLEKLGYKVRSGLLNAKDYGIPQKRTRLFFLARKIFHNSPKAALKSVDHVWAQIHSSKIETFVNFAQGISGLPSLSAGEGNEIQWNSTRGKRSDYAIKMMGNNGSILFNHCARNHNTRDLEAYQTMNEGEDALDLYRKKPELMIYSTENFSTKYYKIKKDDPSPTILAHLRKDANSFIHPEDNRGISPREAARLQSFPDDYRFLGSFGIQFEQIGNAVPPQLAKILADAIKKEIV
jgi:DNA (cytosine-5)-methyltransferase 1